MLGTSTQANDKRSLGPEQFMALQVISEKIVTAHADQINPDYPVQLMIVNSESTNVSTITREHPCAILMQWILEKKNPLRILEWIFLPIMPFKTVSTRLEIFAHLIMKGRARIVEILGRDPETILLPMVQSYLEWGLRNSDDLQIALVGFKGVIRNQFPPHRLLSLLKDQAMEQHPW